MCSSEIGVKVDIFFKSATLKTKITFNFLKIGINVNSKSHLLIYKITS